VGSAISVIAFKNPIHSALALVLTFFSLAGLFILLGAHFVAAVQVIVYAGAIMVLFLFVIMLLNLGSVQSARHMNTAKGFAVILGIILAVEAIYIGVNVFNGTAVTRPQHESEVAVSTITSEQLEQIEAIASTFYLDRDLINSDYVPKVSAQKTDVSALSPSEANELIQKLQGEMGRTDRIGAVLFGKFLLPFEVTSLILLAALIGVIALVKGENPKPVA
jgi:NADH:ubiquinone oxidoreductase subunit 6 (subunit J)